MTVFTRGLLNQSLTGSGEDWPGRYHLTGMQAIELESSEAGMVLFTREHTGLL